ncbi:MAG: hypothetical protein ACFFG0_47235 [Candidatus Thorarchaeota archaeon]
MFAGTLTVRMCVGISGKARCFWICTGVIPVISFALTRKAPVGLLEVWTRTKSIFVVVVNCLTLVPAAYGEVQPRAMN